jgi:uncharacterized membrane protein HdeD (DUF308 family)
MSAVLEAKAPQGQWWVFLLLGIIYLLFGIASFIWQIDVAEILILVFGIFALVSGVVALVGMFRAGKSWWILLFKGIISLAAGTIVLINPVLAGFTIYIFIVIWAIVSGLFEFLGAFFGGVKGGGVALLAIAGIFSVIFGVLLLVLHWVTGFLALMWTFGFYGILYGITLMGYSATARNKSIA